MADTVDYFKQQTLNTIETFKSQLQLLLTDNSSDETEVAQKLHLYVMMIVSSIRLRKLLELDEFVDYFKKNFKEWSLTESLELDQKYANLPKYDQFKLPEPIPDDRQIPLEISKFSAVLAYHIKQKIDLINLIDNLNSQRQDNVVLASLLLFFATALATTALKAIFVSIHLPHPAGIAVLSMAFVSVMLMVVGVLARYVLNQLFNPEYDATKFMRDRGTIPYQFKALETYSILSSESQLKSYIEEIAPDDQALQEQIKTKLQPISNSKERNTTPPYQLKSFREKFFALPPEVVSGSSETIQESLGL